MAEALIVLCALVALAWMCALALLPFVVWRVKDHLVTLNRQVGELIRLTQKNAAPPPPEAPRVPAQRKYRVTGTDKAGGVSALTIKAESEQSAKATAESKGIRVQAIGPAI